MTSIFIKTFFLNCQIYSKPIKIIQKEPIFSLYYIYLKNSYFFYWYFFKQSRN